MRSCLVFQLLLWGNVGVTLQESLRKVHLEIPVDRLLSHQGFFPKFWGHSTWTDARVRWPPFTFTECAVRLLSWQGPSSDSGVQKQRRIEGAFQPMCCSRLLSTFMNKPHCFSISSNQGGDIDVWCVCVAGGGYIVIRDNEGEILAIYYMQEW